MSNGAASARRPAPTRRTSVRPDDLGRIREIQDIIGALNDSMASAGEIARRTARLPVLDARVERLYATRFPRQPIPPATEQIARLGNREFERLLLELLEDLTVLRSEQLDHG